VNGAQLAGQAIVVALQLHKDSGPVGELSRSGQATAPAWRHANTSDAKDIDAVVVALGSVTVA